VHAHLSNLEKIGLLRRDPTKPRAIELLVDKAKKAMRRPGLPIVGQVAAGAPILAEENIEEYVELPEELGGDEGDYVVRVQGDSMRDAGILEGDYVVVKQSKQAADGEIVVALLGDEATVKRFYREKDKIRLQPANKAYKPIRSADVELLGKVVGVYRRV
jgi:repressor LexA